MGAFEIYRILLCFERDDSLSRVFLMSEFADCVCTKKNFCFELIDFANV